MEGVDELENEAKANKEMYVTVPTVVLSTFKVAKKWDKRDHIYQGSNLQLRIQQNALFLWGFPDGLENNDGKLTPSQMPH